MRKLAAITFFTIALAVLAGCRSDDDSGAGGGGAAVTGASSRPAVLEASEDAADAAAGGGGEVTPEAIGDDSVPQVGPQIVQTASVKLSVRRGRFGKGKDVIDDRSNLSLAVEPKELHELVRQKTRFFPEVAHVDAGDCPRVLAHRHRWLSIEIGPLWPSCHSMFLLLAL